VLLMVVCAVVAVGCVCYLVAGYDYLVHWYYGLNSHFYDSHTWAKDFFTPGIKSDGNMYCLVGIALAATGFRYAVRGYGRGNDRKVLTIYAEPAVLPPLALCTTFATCAWWWGNSMSAPSFDEVFSASKAAGTHPFQCISYYMAPNNHLLYNLLNGLLFHQANDKVATGRLLSLAFYIGVVACMFSCFRRLTGSVWLGAFAAIALSLQFMVWGFSFQARGYELCLLCSWGLLMSLFSYVNTKQKKWLYVNTLCIVAGYACIPSFLFFHAGQLFFMLLYRAVYKKKVALFWKCQAIAAAGVFICYLPALCFSGLQCIAQNRYVKPMDHYHNRYDFFVWLLEETQLYITHLFSGNVYTVPLLLLPLLLLLSKKNRNNILFGMFYLCLWVGYFVVVIAMKRTPFERNLIAHYSITLAGVFMVAYWILSMVPRVRKINAGKWVLFPAVLLLTATHFLRTNELLLTDTLYEINMNAVYKATEQGIDMLPAGSSIGFSDNGFYCEYICRHKGYNVPVAATGKETYYVQMASERLPYSNYQLSSTFLDYQVYKRVQ
jgi:hypothetical protein